MAHPRWLAAAFIVPALVLTAACGDDGEDTDDDTAADTTATDTDEAMTEEPMTEETADTVAAGAPEVGCDAAEGATIGYSVPFLDPNFQAISEIVQARFDDNNVTLQLTSADLDPGKQQSDIRTLISQGVDAILVNPVDGNALLPVYQEAADAGIPIVAQETRIGTEFFYSTVTADVEEAAGRGAEILLEQVGEGSVGAINGPDFAEVIARENTAFADTAAEIGLNVVDTQVNFINGQISPEGARQLADAWKQQVPDLAGIWTFNDTSAVGAAGAKDDSWDPVIVSINAQQEAMPLVESGIIYATFDIQPDRLGQGLAYAGLAAVCEQEVPTEIVIPVVEYTADNVAEWRPLSERISDEFSIEFEDRDGRTFLVNP